jgi:hypothetical protein
MIDEATLEKIRNYGFSPLDENDPTKPIHNAPKIKPITDMERW